MQGEISFFSQGRNILHNANEKENLRLVKSLIDCGGDEEVRDKYGDTPLNIAAWYGNLEVVKYLISVRAYKEARNNIIAEIVKYSSNLD
ncbi:ankyrin repeat protein, putative [Trichomonas vaginalis G3]|uniref:Ankyrin repeat protein, putative n=1 Tax=Trichomonas vaginalis (strain ATCC PRA-98 / G3) TaxID=412133 RepID=A2F0I8_TRIV3|nr:ankyrin repeat protein family [Trichomonas vaginalis G3]EAY01568.1 ankyrin repeat protein, putative [Trichomonas vaginalis G3]KAI5529817.1 ankyrin repeat protein family [Trichomonas vaginalis G3]|eukprot:XP_001314209.1 ankyrin repeat protein [Trichomonas vaginalis G3]